MAKTQNSLSDDPKLLGKSANLLIVVREIEIAAAGRVCHSHYSRYHADAGLRVVPTAEHVNVDDEGNVTGLF